MSETKKRKTILAIIIGVIIIGVVAWMIINATSHHASPATNQPVAQNASEQTEDADFGAATAETTPAQSDQSTPSVVPATGPTDTFVTAILAGISVFLATNLIMSRRAIMV